MHITHLVEMEKVHLRNDGYFWHVCVADLFSRRKIWWSFVTCDQYGSFSLL